MFIYLPAYAKLISISSISIIKPIKYEGGSWEVTIFYEDNGERIGQGIYRGSESECQKYIQQLSNELPSVTLMRGF